MPSRVYCDRCKVAIPPGVPVWRICLSEELDDGMQVEVRQARVVWQYCARCAASLELDRLPPPPERAAPRLGDDARDELAIELDDFYVEALGRPAHVLHDDDARAPHIDVFIYAPSTLLTGWCLVTAGRSTEPVGDRRFELVQHLAPQLSLDDIEEAAIVLRRVALGSAGPRWTFAPMPDERFASLGTRLRGSPSFLLAAFKR